MADNSSHANTPQAASFGIANTIAQPVIKKEDTGANTPNVSTTDVYRPRPQLPPPFVVMRRLADLMKDLDAGIIDVDPEYQREVVWTAERMTGLINSLMENFYIPPIILNRKTLASDGNVQKHTLVCVDGKQRLSSVRAFTKGLIPCHDHVGDKWWYCDDTSTRRKKILPEKTRKLFLAKEFVSFEFKDLSAHQEEELFARVQMGVQLNLAEKMRASSGPWQELARLFVDDFPKIFALMKDRTRAKDFQLALACFSQIVEVMHPSSEDGVPVFKQTHAALPKLLINKGAVDDGIKSHLASIWTTFNRLVSENSDTFTNANKYLGGVQTFAPIEMVAVTVLITMYSDTRNDQLLLGDVQAMRRALRENFAELRMNRDVWKFIWGYLDSLERMRGAVDGSTVDQRQTSRVSGSITASRTHNTSLNELVSGMIDDSIPATTKTAPPLSTSHSKNVSSIAISAEGTPEAKRKRIDPIAALRTPRPRKPRMSAAFTPGASTYTAASLSPYFETPFQTSATSNMIPVISSQAHPYASFDQHGIFTFAGGSAPAMTYQPVAGQGQAYTAPHTRPNTTSEVGLALPAQSSVLNGRAVADLVDEGTIANQGSFRASRGAFTSTINDQEWDGILSSTTVHVEPHSDAVPRPQPLESLKSPSVRKFPLAKQKRRSVPKQEDHVIDLTSDNE